MADLVNAAPGQCRLEYDSATALKLVRKDGAYLPLKISGTWQAKLIPSTPPTLSTAGVANSTRYYIYAFDNAGTLTLERDTTGYVSDTDVGVMVKSGDPTRTLVGLALTNASGQWQVQGLGTLSWFNRRRQRVENKSTGYGSVAGSFPAGAEVNSAFRQHYVAWADCRALAYINGSMGPLDASSNVVALARDTTVLEQQYHGTGGANFSPCGLVSSIAGDEQDHYITVFAGSTTTVYVNGNQTANQGTTLTVGVDVLG